MFEYSAEPIEETDAAAAGETTRAASTAGLGAEGIEADGGGDRAVFGFGPGGLGLAGAVLLMLAYKGKEGGGVLLA